MQEHSAATLAAQPVVAPEMSHSGGAVAAARGNLPPLSDRWFTPGTNLAPELATLTNAAAKRANLAVGLRDLLWYCQNYQAIGNVYDDRKNVKATK